MLVVSTVLEKGGDIFKITIFLCCLWCVETRYIMLLALYYQIMLCIHWCAQVLSLIIWFVSFNEATNKSEQQI